MLVEALRDGVFVPPLEEAGRLDRKRTEANISHAPKITKEDGHVRPSTWSAEDILRRNRVLGDLWGVVTSDAVRNQRRVILHKLEETEVSKTPQLVGQSEDVYRPGRLFASRLGRSAQLYILTCDKPARLLRVTSCTLEGGRKGAGVQELLQKLNNSDFATLHPTPLTMVE